ncbi:unnamed protein product [Adineta steineri]|uniref:Uncharacterized protein n=1 Tax=Adineta steineri TaxID=433720 RepID=A0A815A0B1_9BILA|nr:unnamed protein product [Adineta steineri]CAF4129628.1 unnamed protein product [Adineta steineri]
MASSSRTICSECMSTAIYKYNRSNKTYCKFHNDQHRKLLDEQLDWLTVDHDDLQQKLLDHESTPNYHPSMSVIDKWEQESIARIQNIAVLARQRLLDVLNQHIVEVKKELKTLTPKMREARNRIKPFDDTNIQEWKTLLQNLKKLPDYPVINDESNIIYGVTIDTKRKQQTFQFDSNPPVEPNSPVLISNAHNISPSRSKKYETGDQTTRASTSTSKKNDDSKRVTINNITSTRSHNVTPGGVLIIREEEKNITPPVVTPAPRVRRAHAEIPFDSGTYYPLRGPATIYG